MTNAQCEFCEGCGYIEICEGLGPKVDCPHCSSTTIFVLDDGETYGGEGFPVKVTAAQLERIIEGEKVYNVVPDWDKLPQESKDGAWPLRTELSNDPGPAIEVFIKGMGTCNMAEGYGSPVYLEFYEDNWTLHVWADINQEDATHRIDLSGALESRRLDTDLD